jgi:hypothetical protein
MCWVALLVAWLASIAFFQTFYSYAGCWHRTVSGVVILSCNSEVRLYGPVASDEAIVPASDGSWIWIIHAMIIGEGYLLPQCHFIHHKSQWITLGFNPVHRDEKPTTKHLSCATALPGI